MLLSSFFEGYCLGLLGALAYEEPSSCDRAPDEPIEFFDELVNIHHNELNEDPDFDA